jgi:hypothetical protein
MARTLTDILGFFYRGVTNGYHYPTHRNWITPNLPFTGIKFELRLEKIKFTKQKS